MSSPRAPRHPGVACESRSGLCSCSPAPLTPHAPGSTVLELQGPCFFPCMGWALTLSTCLASMLFSLLWMLFLPQVLAKQMPSQPSGLSSNITGQPKDSSGLLLNHSLLLTWISFLVFVALITIWMYPVYLFNGFLTYFLASPSEYELCEGFVHYCFPRTQNRLWGAPAVPSAPHWAPWEPAFQTVPEWSKVYPDTLICPPSRAFQAVFLPSPPPRNCEGTHRADPGWLDTEFETLIQRRLKSGL